MIRNPTDSSIAERLSSQRFPLDMIGVCVAVGVLVALYYLVPTTPVRFLVAVPLLFFLPGYVLVGVLFPRGGRSPEQSRAEDDSARALATIRDLDRVTLAERLGLSFGLSVALVPLLGLLLEPLPVDAFDGAIGPALVVFVLGGALVASIRRLRTPVGDRFGVPVGTVIAVVAAPFSGPMPRAERIATIGLAVTVLLAVVAVGYAFAVPQEGQSFTDLRVMTDSPGGELVLGDYPDDIATNGTELTIGIDNQEGGQQTYTVVVTAEQIIGTDGSVNVIGSRELGRFEATLADGQRLRQPQTITADTGGEFRFNYYLYEGDAPATPDADSAYRHVYFTASTVSSGPTGVDAETPVDGDPDIDSTIDTDAAEIVPISEEPAALDPTR